MKTSKFRKLLSLLLAVLMLASLLTACAEEDDDDDDRPRKKKPTATTATTEVTESTGDTFDDDPTEATSPEPTDAPFSDDDAAQTGDSLSFGVIDRNTYTNHYAGFGCTLNKNWTYKSAEELQALTGYVAGEMFEGTALEGFLDKYPQVTDMLAENATDLVSINVLYQQPDATSASIYSRLTEEQIIDMTLSQVETLKQTYANAGIEVEKFEKVTVTFLGQTRTALAMTATMQGVPYYTLQIIDYTRSPYGVFLTLGSFMENNTEDLLDLFFVVD